jgi:hypothetical protein
MENPNSSNRKLIIGGLFVGVVLIFLVIITLVLTSLSKPKTAGNEIGTGTGGGSLITTTPNGSKTTPFPQVSKPVTRLTTTTAPTVQFSNWQFNIATPSTAVSTASTYGFKTNYSVPEVTRIAEALSTSEFVKSDQNQVLAYTVDFGGQTVNALFFNTTTGAYSYINSKGLALNTPTGTASANIDSTVYNFLQSKNLVDPTVKVTAHYMRKDKPNTLFVELHRDWQAAGLPILNFIGTINLTETEHLNALTLTTPLSTVAANSDIYATSDRRDGRERPDDFNTMTVAIDTTTNSIIGIRSNIRQFTATPKSTSLISFETAHERLKNNQYAYIFTSPTGSGNPAWDKVYPKNIAPSSQVTVTEERYVYLESMPDQLQTELKPYVLVKGTAKLKSGYNVKFVAAVPADVNTTVQNNKVLGISTVLAQNTGGNGGDQQNTLTVVPSPYVTPSVSPTLAPSTAGPCLPDVGMLDPRFTLTFDGQPVTLGFTSKRWSFHGGQWVEDPEPDPRWYWIPGTGFDALNPTQKIDKLKQDYDIVMSHLHDFDRAATEKSGGTGLYSYSPKTGQNEYRPWDLILKDLTYRGDHGLSTNCPINFSGLSPDIFVYAPEGTVVDIQPNAPVTYSDPSLVDNVWHVTVGANNSLTVNDVQRDSIYYEHNVKTFSRPQNGWIVEKSKLKSFTQNVAQKLQLNAAETARLYIEVYNASSDYDSNKVFVGLIDQKVIDKNIPLTIVPAPESVRRFHFYVGNVEDTAVPAPKLSPVVRKSFMLVELGAVSEKQVVKN